MINMVQPDIKPEDILTNQGNAQLFVTDEVVNGLNIAPKLGFLKQAGKRYNFYSRDKTSKEIFDEGLMGKPQPSAKGSDLLMISGTELTADSKELLTKGFRYVFHEGDYLDSPESFIMDMEDMCYAIAVTMETSVAAACIAAAVESSATIKDGVWSTSSMIAEDLTGFLFEYRRRGVKGPLDTLFYNATNQEELANYIMAVEGIKNLIKNGDVITYNAIDHIYAANGIDEGKTLGWSSVSTPGKVVTRTIPGAYTPIKVKDGTQGQLPAINMKLIKGDGEGMEPIIDLRFGAHWTTAITRESNIFYKSGL